METQTAFSDLQQLSLLYHGDARERAVWPTVSSELSSYETFWREFVVLLTNRVDPSKRFGADDWIRLRPGLPRNYEDLAMSNYSAFYYAASVVEQMSENEKRIASGRYFRPELVFFHMEICIENARRLHDTARALLLELNVKCKLPKQPNSCYQTVSAYRNAFTHDPILGRALTHRRELLPPPSALPKTRRKDDFLRWSDTEKIPVNQMIDALICQKGLWKDLVNFLESTWGSLTQACVTARTDETFIKAVNLTAFLPIRIVIDGLSTANPFAASGTII